jgi:hypothetical protein
VGGNRGDLACLEARGPGSCAWGQRDGDCVTDASEVVLSHPLTQLHNAGGQERLAVQYLRDVLDRVRIRCGRVLLNDATGQRARSNGRADPRADDWQLEMIGNSIREAIEKWDGDGD